MDIDIDAIFPQVLAQRFLDIPEELDATKRAEVEEERKRLRGGTIELDGVLYWSASQLPVPPYVFADAFIETPPGQEAAYRRSLEEVAKKIKPFGIEFESVDVNPHRFGIEREYGLSADPWKSESIKRHPPIDCTGMFCELMAHWNASAGAYLCASGHISKRGS